MEWVTENNQRVPRMVQKSNTLFSRDESINGPSDFGQGPTRSCPFSMGIPSLRPAHSGGRIETMIKGCCSCQRTTRYDGDCPDRIHSTNVCGDWRACSTLRVDTTVRASRPGARITIRVCSRSRATETADSL